MKILPPLKPQDFMISAMAYPLGIIVSPYVFFSDKKQESYVFFHAVQGLVLNIVAILLISFGFLFLLLFSRTSPTYTQISSQGAGEWQNTYMTFGCFFVGLSILYFIFIFFIFLFLMYCAARAWNGEDFRIPYLGNMIAEKYFQDTYSENEPAISKDAKPSVLDLPSKRHDIPFKKTKL